MNSIEIELKPQGVEAKEKEQEIDSARAQQPEEQPTDPELVALQTLLADVDNFINQDVDVAIREADRLFTELELEHESKDQSPSLEELEKTVNDIIATSKANRSDPKPMTEEEFRQAYLTGVWLTKNLKDLVDGHIVPLGGEITRLKGELRSLTDTITSFEKEVQGQQKILDTHQQADAIGRFVR